MKYRYLDARCSFAGCKWTGAIPSNYRENDRLLVIQSHKEDTKGDHGFVGTMDEVILDTHDHAPK